MLNPSSLCAARSRVAPLAFVAAALAAIAGCSDGETSSSRGDPSSSSAEAGSGGASSSSGSGGHGGAGGAGGAGGHGGAGGAGGGAGLCAPGSTQPCYSGPPDTQSVGACAQGLATCNADGTAFGPCEGDTLPSPEACDTPADDDCDGTPNEGCACVPGSSFTCYEGPSGTSGVGACKSGIHTCAPDGLSYGPCQGQVLPTEELCFSQTDDDCNGYVDDGCICEPGSTWDCYDGPNGTLDVGVCKSGVITCQPDGKSFGPCVGQVLPAVEVCINGLDDDCNAYADNLCVCDANAVEPCFDGAPWMIGQGICVSGTHTCAPDGKAWGACVGQVTPAEETCATASDDDCDGAVNEVCEPCAPGAVEPCYEGPAGTDGVGPCVGGARTCLPDGSGFGPCQGQVTPSAEMCASAADESCDGASGCSGAHLWSKGYSSQGGFFNWETVPTDMAVDRDGNVIVTGYMNGSLDFGGGPLPSTTAPNGFIAKLDAAGNPLWSKSLGADVDYGIIYAVATDAEGNIFITGTFEGTADFDGWPLTSMNETDAFVAKLTPSGQFLWRKTFLSTRADQAKSIALDAAGNIILAGDFKGHLDFGGGWLMTGGGLYDYDMFLAKLDAAGNHIFSKRFGGNGTWDYGEGVAVDGAGNIAFTGYGGAADFGGGVLTSAGDDDVFVAKFNEAGDHLWSQQFGDADQQRSFDVAFDAAGRVLVTGYVAGGIDFGGGPLTDSGGLDAFLAKLDGAGGHVWSKRIGAAGQSNRGSKVAVDGAGNTLVTGHVGGSVNFGSGPVPGFSWDVFVAKYDDAGAYIWAKRFGAQWTENGTAVASDAQGNVLLTGKHNDSINLGGQTFTSDDGVFIAKFAP